VLVAVYYTKAYRRNRLRSALNFNLDTRWEWLVFSRPGHFASGERNLRYAFSIRLGGRQRRFGR